MPDSTSFSAPDTLLTHTPNTGHHFLPQGEMNHTTPWRPEDISLPPSPPLEARDPLQDAASFDAEAHPQTLQRSVSPFELLSSGSLSVQIPPRLRAKSPSSRGHLRSQSSNATPRAPPMQRAHSSPGLDTSGRLVLPLLNTGPRRPPSPSSFTGRRRSPLRSAMEESYPGGPTWNGLVIEPNIPEHAELDISTTTLPALSAISEADFYQTSSSASLHNTFPRARRRPTSPLHQSASAPSLHTTSPSLGSFTGSSPTLAAQKYTNEPYPYYSFSSASSMPSTPTSMRSRSPSISSLETIPDTPDAEEAARVEAEELAKLRTAAGLEEFESKRRSPGFGSKKERKRWSVCGAERRADFSLEPIEE